MPDGTASIAPGQHQIQPFRQHATMRFDELAVHAGNVHLPQVDARARMLLQPGDDIEQAIPGVDQLQRTQGYLRSQSASGGCRWRVRSTRDRKRAPSDCLRISDRASSGVSTHTP